jgi:hypothetical protein
VTDDNTPIAGDLLGQEAGAGQRRHGGERRDCGALSGFEATLFGLAVMPVGAQH